MWKWHDAPKAADNTHSLKGVRTISGKRPVHRLAIGLEVVERLVEGSGRIRRVTAMAATIALVRRRETSVVAPQAAPSVGEHASPMVAHVLRQSELQAVVVANSLRVRRASGTGTE